MFGQVYVAIGRNSSKTTTFTVEERIKLIEKCVRNLPNVKVISFSGLLADFCYEMNIKFVVKGVRNFQDFDYERLLNDIGSTQQHGIETVTLFSRPELSHVSSSATKELLKNHGLVDNYVPLSVKEALECKVLQKYIIGVTGEIGVGKSFFSKLCVEIGKEEYYSRVYEVDLDKIGHDILQNRTEPVYVELRQKIIETFSLTPSDSVDRKELGKIVFNDNSALDRLNSLMRIPMLTRLRQEIGKMKGIVLLNGALLIEANFLPLCNNNLFMVCASKENQLIALRNRGYSEEQILRRQQSQFDIVEKNRRFMESIEKYGSGKLISIGDIYDKENVVKTIKLIFDEVFTKKLV
jgi:pantetheine-phosphate adenylyltransferase